MKPHWKSIRQYSEPIEFSDLFTFVLIPRAIPNDVSFFIAIEYKSAPPQNYGICANFENTHLCSMHSHCFESSTPSTNRSRGYMSIHTM